MAQSKPVQKFREGGISCALCENDVRIGNVTKSVLKRTVERRYKDADGTWKGSGSYDLNKIPRVIWCLQKAYDHTVEEGNIRTDENGIEEEIIA